MRAFLDSSYFKTFESTLGSTVTAVKSKMTPSQSAMNFNGNNKDEPTNGATGGSVSKSSTHDEHLHFGGNGPDGKK